MFTNISIILRWIARHWFPLVPVSITDSCTEVWLNKLKLWINTHGVIHTIKRVKAMRLMVTRYICGKPLYNNDLMIGATSDGFPTQLNFVKGLIDSGEPQSIRYVMTLLGVTRVWPSPVGPDLSVIEDPSTAVIRTIDNSFVELFVRDYCGHFNPLVERPGPAHAFLSLKAGPAGGPSILHAAWSAATFTGVNLRGLASIGGDKFMDWVKELKFSITLSEKARYTSERGAPRTPHGTNPNLKVELRNRRILSVYDPEAKHRLVTSFDYLTQLALTPFMEWCFSSLRNDFPKDRTFTQSPFIYDKVDGHSFHSFDLSSATDRFPIELQCQLVTEIAGPAYASAWRNLLISEPMLFQLCPKPGPKQRMIKFAVGQPMGARSSWTVFTISHHMVVQYAAFGLGKYPFNQYILLGDDIVIYDDQVASEYLRLISDLGVEISTNKSHISLNSYEFAKRWFRNGIEISGVPLKGLVNNWDNPNLLFSSVSDLIKAGRGPRSIIHSVDLILDLLRHLRRPLLTLESGGFFEFGLFLSGNKHKAISPSMMEPAYRTKDFRKLRTSLKDLWLVGRNLNDFDPQATRAFMADATSSNEYILPSDYATLKSEWIRTSSGVVNGMAMSTLKRLNSFYGDFISSFDKIIASSRYTQRVRSTNPVGIHPLTFAIYNSVNHYHSMNKAMGYTTDLSKQLETITLLDLDQLKSEGRTAKKMVFHFNTLGRKLRHQLKTDHDLYIAKARTMQFGRALLDTKFAIERAHPHIKRGLWTLYRPQSHLNVP